MDEQFWKESNGIITFIGSLNDIAEDPIKHLEAKGYEVSPRLKQIVSCPGYVPTKRPYRIMILRRGLFPKGDLTTRIIRETISNYGREHLNVDPTIITRKMLSDENIKKMGFSEGILGMYEVVKGRGFFDDPFIIGSNRRVFSGVDRRHGFVPVIEDRRDRRQDYKPGIKSCVGHPDNRIWSEKMGFACVDPYFNHEKSQ